MGRMTRVCRTLVEEHKAVRRTLVLWACALITWTTVQLFSDIEAITAAASTAFGLVTGLLATVIGFYQWTRGREGK